MNEDRNQKGRREKCNKNTQARRSAGDLTTAATKRLASRAKSQSFNFESQDCSSGDISFWPKGILLHHKIQLHDQTGACPQNSSPEQYALPIPSAPLTRQLLGTRNVTHQGHHPSPFTPSPLAAASPSRAPRARALNF